MIELRHPKHQSVYLTCADCEAGRICECSGDAFDYARTHWHDRLWSMFRDGVQLWQRAKGGNGETARNAFRQPKEAS